MARRHILTNKAAPDASLLCDAVVSFDSTVQFPVKTPKQQFHNYGFGIQHIYDGKEAEIERGGGQIITVPAFSLYQGGARRTVHGAHVCALRPWHWPCQRG